MNRPSPLHSCAAGHVANCDGSRVLRLPRFTLDSPAKLNIFLEVLGKRPDGFHELETVMLRTQFCDQLTFQPSLSSDITLNLSDSSHGNLQSRIPLDKSNLILKAAYALQEFTGTSIGAHIILNKRIPPESGLGGGSSNAATALIGCRRLWNIDVSDTELHTVAASLGSDINFLLSGAAAAVCRGRGEIIEPIPLGRKLYFVAMRPHAGNSTPAVFARTKISSLPVTSQSVTEHVIHGTGSLNASVFNRLTFAAGELNPEMAGLLKRIPQIMRRPAFMSGSGSTVYVVAGSHPDATTVADRLKAACRLPVWILESA
jgi:4-diphosphocytidyl-2-C-methyl-D-erythritol kinase